MKGVWTSIKLARQAIDDGDLALARQILDNISKGFHAERDERNIRNRQNKRRKSLYTSHYKDQEE